MTEAVFFRNLTTKGLTAINSGERYFEGWLTVQVKDKQGEVTIVDELMKVLPVWIDRGAPISDTHSNRIIGKGINYSKSVYKDADGTEYPAIKVTGKIHKNYELDNDIWGKIKSGEYKGLSFGGATKSDREPMRMKDGSIAYSLKDLEHYEVAVCRDPAVPLALITEFNTLAKAAVEGENIGGGRMLIKCSKFGCYVDKQEQHEKPRGRGPEYDRQHMAEQRELAQQMGDVAGQTNEYNTRRRLGLKPGVPFKRTQFPGGKTAAEAGLKVPEARNEALVYDDKTHDQPSETPLVKSCPWCTTSGKGIVNPAEERHDYKKLRELHDDDPDRFHADFPFKKDKAEDWSNADGDRHSMYNQDTDEGGMGKHKQKGCKCGDPKCKDPKCKKHKREVGTGHGGEKNDTGEVNWSGSGSPYPKVVKGCGCHHEEEKKQKKKGHYSTDVRDYEPDEILGREGPKETKEGHISRRKRKRRPKKASIMTNILSRLKSLDLLTKKKELACRNCKGLTTQDKCPGCSSTDLTEDWSGQVLIADPKESKIARTLGHKNPGKFALDVKADLPGSRGYGGPSYSFSHTLPTRSGKKKDPKRTKKRKLTAGEKEKIAFEKNPNPDVVANYERNIKEMSKKAVMTNILSRLKSIKLITKPQVYPKGDKRGEKDVCEEKGVCPDAVFEGTEFITTNEQKTLDEEERNRDKLNPTMGEEYSDLQDFTEAEGKHSVQSRPGAKKRMKEIEIEEKKQQGKHSKTGRQAVQSKKGFGKAQAIKRIKELQDERRRLAGRKKEGEYGGINTGEVEWTEPRDTSNDRRDSKLEKQ